MEVSRSKSVRWATVAVFCLLVLSMSRVWAVTIVHISTSSDYSLALSDDGRVWAWGHNDRGQLGDGTTMDRYAPGLVPGIDHITAIAAGYQHALARKNDGTVYSWGDNASGQLGRGTTGGPGTPAVVPGLTDVLKIAAGGVHSVAVKVDGTVMAWGKNNYGQCGPGVIQKTTPTSIANFTGVSDATAGFDFTVFLKSDSTVWACGRNNTGQIGDTTSTTRYTPVQVASISGVTSVSAGYGHTVAMKNDSTVWTWGLNSDGQIGDGTMTVRRTPYHVPVYDSSGLVTGAFVGLKHSMATVFLGSTWFWGDGLNAQFGNGDFDGSFTPVPVVGAWYASMRGGANHTIALKYDGSVWGWGYSEFGEVGTGSGGGWYLYPVQLYFDDQAPTGHVTVNNGDNYTSSTSVTLTITASDDSGNISDMCLSNDGVFDTETWEPYATTKAWTVPSGDGLKRVWIKFRDVAGNECYPDFDNITLDTVAPTGSISYGQYTNNRYIELNTSASDNASGVSTMAVSTDGVFDTESWWGYSSTYGFTLPDSDGPYTFYARYRDQAGNESTSTVTTVTLDRVRPAGNIYINNDAAQTSSTSVTLNLPASDENTVSQMRVSNDGVMDTEQWEPYATAKTWELLSGAGTKYVWAQFKDGAGNVSPIYADDIVYTPPPSVSISGPSTASVVSNGAVVLYTATYANCASISLAASNVTLNKTGTARGMVVVTGTDSSTRTVAITSISGEGTLGISLAAGTATGSSGAQASAAGPSTVVSVLHGAVAAGNTYSLVLDWYGTMWGWGYGAYGQLGDGGTGYRLLPIAVQPPAQFAAIAAYNSHSVAVDTSGSVWAWGDNSRGQLGDGTVQGQLSPRAVPGLAGFVSVSAGAEDTIALKSDGTVYTWGRAIQGLGDGSTTERHSPAPVSSLLHDVAAIATGDDHFVALRSDGTVWTWGSNSNGQLGIGSTTHSSVPVQVTGIDQVIAVAAGEHHTLAVRSDGSVWAWGWNHKGQLGNYTTVDKLAPTRVADLTNVVAVRGGSSYSLALKGDGRVWAWGDNAYDQLGTGRSIAGSLAPVQAQYLADVKAISAQYLHAIALKADGTLLTWGWNACAQLGNGTGFSQEFPEPVMLDSLPPTGSITINSGATYINSSSVTLTLTSSDNSGTVAQMCLSNDGVFDTEQWENYATSRVWNLTGADGAKTVYAKFRDAWGHESVVVSATITLDTTPPTVQLAINNGADICASSSVTLYCHFGDTFAGQFMRISNDGVFDTEPWQLLQGMVPWQLTSGSGVKTVWVKTKDQAGNESDVATDTITVTAPVLTTARALWDPIIATAASHQGFKVCGKVRIKDADNFWLDDGSGVYLVVNAPGYQTVAQDGDMVSAVGSVSPSTPGVPVPTPPTVWSHRLCIEHH